jgi:cobyric acid synthase
LGVNAFSYGVNVFLHVPAANPIGALAFGWCSQENMNGIFLKIHSIKFTFVMEKAPFGL